MRNILGLLFVAGVILLSSCGEKPRPLTPEEMAADDQKAVVKEVIQANSYTYLRLDKKGSEMWIAITKSDVKSGETVYFKPDMEMKNFFSKDLQRTFESIWFVQHISRTPLTEKNPGGLVSNTPQKPVLTKLDVKVEQPEGGISIADLYKRKKELSGKTVIVKGHVTKVNTGIMNRNWIHIQDGTSEGEYFDLTLTTSAEPMVGDVVTFSGKLSVDKDFGAGYTYTVIVEDAVLVK